MFRTAHMIPMQVLQKSPPGVGIPMPSAYWMRPQSNMFAKTVVRYHSQNANVSLKILEYVGMNDSHAGSLISTASFQRAAIASNIDPL